VIRLFGWDHSGMPVRHGADFQRRNKIGAFLATEESLAYRPGRAVVYGEIVTLALGIIAKVKLDRLELNRPSPFQPLAKWSDPSGGRCRNRNQ